MDTARIIPAYLLWHYTKALTSAFHIWLNLLWFAGRFFSLGTLTLSLFAPWKRMTEERRRKFDIEDMAAVIVVNMISRIIGAIVRLVIIIMGLVSLAALLICIAVFYIVWIAMPLVIFLLVVYGMLFAL